jgi:hypothetical protein
MRPNLDSSHREGERSREPKLPPESQEFGLAGSLALPGRFVERAAMASFATELVNVTLPVFNEAARLPDGFARLWRFLALNSAPTT